MRLPAKGWATVTCCVLLSGCSDSRFGSVEGRVTVGGKQVAAGRVVFRNETTTLDGPIEADGRYRLTHRGSTRVPVGSYGVILLPPELRTPTNSSKLPAIDERVYAKKLRDTATSGVERRIESGVTTIDVEFGGGTAGPSP